MLIPAQRKIHFLLFFWLPLFVGTQSTTGRVETIEGHGGNVVNVYFGTNQGDGPCTPKRETESQEECGETAQVSDEGENEVVVAGMTSVESCWDLLQKGTTRSGYYLMRSDSVNQQAPVYKYCDFHPYTDVSSCTELIQNRNISENGYYRLQDRSGQLRFHYCPDPYTCQQLSHRDGIRESGLYRLGPPGNEFDVYCNFFSGQAVTEVFHDFMQEVKAASSCGTQGCYTVTPRYQISLSNIVKIIENSRECRQHIKMRCQGSVLLYKPNPYAWWVSRLGEKMLYWGGAVSKRSYYCACGETRSCIDNNYYCNCDNNAASVTTQDEGYLTDKAKLPVREMKFGDLDDSSEKAWHTLGKLECSGQA